LTKHENCGISRTFSGSPVLLAFPSLLVFHYPAEREDQQEDQQLQTLDSKSFAFIENRSAGLLGQKRIGFEI